MKLIFLRHGIALEREQALLQKMPDAERPLVEKGKQRVLQMAEFLAGFEANINHIVHSPLVRAKETAQIVKKVFVDSAINEHSCLSPSASVIDVENYLNSLKGAETVILVGHEPNLSETISYFLCGNTDLSIQLTKTAICTLDLHSIKPKQASLLYLIQPKQVLAHVD